jgi:Protein of unknown function (DUF3050)
MVLNYAEQLTQKLSPLTSKITNHTIYHEISSLTNLCRFMEQHVFAVWDFMCLLKELHRHLVSTSAPWFPPKDALGANLINSLLVEEEGDIAEDGIHYASHYETYITAMEKIGANTRPIKKLLALLMNGNNIADAIESVQLRPATKNFVLTTFSFFKLETHEIAAAFVYGREGITSPMFSSLIEQWNIKIDHNNQYDLSTLIFYLKRHIELDDNEHFPKAIKMLTNLIGSDEKKWKEAEIVAIKALTARIDFLTDIQKSLS